MVVTGLARVNVEKKLKNASVSFRCESAMLIERGFQVQRWQPGEPALKVKVESKYVRGERGCIEYSRQLM